MTLHHNLQRVFRSTAASFALALLLVGPLVSAPAAAQPVEELRLDDPELPARGYDVTALADGGWVAVWEEPPTAEDPGALVAQRFRADGTPVGIRRVVWPEAVDTLPRVAARRDGSFFCVAWTEYLEGPPTEPVRDLHLRCLPTDGTAGEAPPRQTRQVSGYGGHDLDATKLSVSEGRRLFQQTLPPEVDGAWGEPVRIDLVASWQAIRLQGASDGAPGALVWTVAPLEFGGSDSDVEIRVLSGSTVHPGPVRRFPDHFAVASLEEARPTLVSWLERNPETGQELQTVVQPYPGAPTPGVPGGGGGQEIPEPRVAVEHEGLGGSALAATPGGGALAWWAPRIGPGGWELRVRPLDREGRPEDPVRTLLAVPSGRQPTVPRLHRLADGRLLATWQTTPADQVFGFPPPPSGLHAAVFELLAEGAVLSLQGGRFEVDVVWSDPYNGGAGIATARPLTDDTGAFWFFRESNLELLVKVLDGRPVNGHWWVFHGGLSTVAYTITVTDRLTDEVRTYVNPPFDLASDGDTAAFRDPNGSAGTGDGPAGATSALARYAVPAAAELDGAGPCTSPDLPVAALPGICLHDRFEVLVAWEDPHAGPGAEEPTGGVAEGVRLSEDGGYLWFFDPDNAELLVKVLDGRAVNGHWWVFSGALTNVGYTLVVRDTETATEVRFTNPQGTFRSFVETAAFPRPAQE